MIHLTAYFVLFMATFLATFSALMTVFFLIMYHRFKPDIIKVEPSLNNEHTFPNKSEWFITIKSRRSFFQEKEEQRILFRAVGFEPYYEHPGETYLLFNEEGEQIKPKWYPTSLFKKAMRYYRKNLWN